MPRRDDMSTLASAHRLPRGRVTQARVALSEWTRSSGSSAHALLAAGGVPLHDRHRGDRLRRRRPPLPAHEPAGPADFHPLEGEPGGRADRAARDRRARSPHDHRRILDRDDPRLRFMAVPKRLPVLWAKAAVFGAHHLPAPCSPSALVAFFVGRRFFAGHVDLGLRAPRPRACPSAPPIPNGRRPLRTRRRRDPAQHGRRDRLLRRDDVRPAADLIERSCPRAGTGRRPVSAAPGRRGDPRDPRGWAPHSPVAWASCSSTGYADYGN